MKSDIFPIQTWKFKFLILIVFQNVIIFSQKWMKPHGQLLVSEYVHGSIYPNVNKEYIDYIDDRGYQLVTVKEYGEILER